MSASPLHRKLLKYTLLVAGIPLLLTTLLALFWLYPQATRDLHNQQQQLVAAVASQVEEYLNSSRAITLSTASLHQHDLDRHNLEHVQHVLEANVQTMPHLRSMYLVDARGRIVTTAVTNGSQKLQQDLLQLDLSRNPLFQKALAERKPLWSDSFLSLVGGGISVALAVPAGSRVMIAEFELTSLTEFLKHINTVEGQSIFVLDRTGQVIADHDGAYTAQQLNLSNISLVRDGLQSKRPVTTSYRLHDRLMVGSLHQVPGIEWTVLVSQPAQLAYRNLLSTGGITAAGVVAALLTGLGIALVLTRSLATRFEQLTRHAQQTATEEAAGSWPHSNILEFNQLADSLQQMSDRLHERATLLEQEIEQRQRSQEELHEKALLLEQEISERVLAEQSLQVKQVQIEALNRTLELRVQEELLKNREKDGLMIQQGRLAAMGEMMSNIAHQWRQPLNELGIIIQMLRIDYDDKLLDEKRIDEFSATCMCLIQHMSHTINTFRDFVKNDTTTQQFDVTSAIATTSGLVQASLLAAGITLDLKLEQTCLLKGQPNEFSQALLNLINNARDVLTERCTPHPSLLLGCRCRERLIQVTVEDNGGGIPPEIIGKIFDPYFTTKHKSQGTGLGLYITRQIIEGSMGGILKVENTTNGARFTLIFACHEACCITEPTDTNPLTSG